MSQNKISLDDPRLTAYALGELEGSERAAVEAALRMDPTARAAVEGIRATAAQMAAALATEPMPETKSVVRSDLARHTAAADGYDYGRRATGPVGKLFQFPQFYYVVGGAAAACFAMFVALRTPVPRPPRTPFAPSAAETVRTEIVFTPPTAPATESVDAAASDVADKAPGASEATTKPGLVANDTPPPALREEKKVAETTAVPPPPMAVELVTTMGQDLTLLGSIQPTPPQTPRVPSFLREHSYGSTGSALPSPPSENDRDNVVKLDAYTVTGEREDVARAIASQNMHSFFGARGRTTFSVDESGARARIAGPAPGYAFQPDNDFLAAQQNPLSTFGVDVDTASYASVRRFIRGGRLPPGDAVRIEELVNHFPYHYPAPRAAAGARASSSASESTFAAALEVASAPWAPTHRLVRIGLKGREVASEARPAANLVFLVDVSNSMNEPNKLPLVKESMRLLVRQLHPEDRVAIVTYPGNSGVALPSTPAAKAAEILASLDALKPGGSTSGTLGLPLAYEIANAHLVTGGLNRVILCTDGHFNVGVTGDDALAQLVEEKAKAGVALSVLGFGMGGTKNAKIELLAIKGNGDHGYIDSRREAEKLLVAQINGTLVTIAQDVKVQVEFNPAKVASYRLIGYENRLLKKEDFNRDYVDAGEFGAGHTVTALYEIVPVNAKGKSESISHGVDELKYIGRTTVDAPKPVSNELLTVKVRYKEATGELSRKMEFALLDKGAQFAGASADFKFAAAVAGFGMILRDSPHKGTATLGDVVAWAGPGIKDDPGGYRGEFVNLVNSAKGLVH